MEWVVLLIFQFSTKSNYELKVYFYFTWNCIESTKKSFAFNVLFEILIIQYTSTSEWMIGKFKELTTLKVQNFCPILSKCLHVLNRAIGILRSTKEMFDN